MHISNCLSRCVPLPAPNQGPVFPETNQIEIFEVAVANESDIQRIRLTQKKDPVFQELEHLCQEGWPEHCNQVPELAIAYWDYRHDIAVIDGIIVKSQRILVPQKMGECLLRKLHRVHQYRVLFKEPETSGSGLACRNRSGDLFWPAHTNPDRNKQQLSLWPQPMPGTFWVATFFSMLVDSTVASSTTTQGTRGWSQSRTKKQIQWSNISRVSATSLVSLWR